MTSLKIQNIDKWVSKVYSTIEEAQNAGDVFVHPDGALSLNGSHLLGWCSYTGEAGVLPKDTQKGGVKVMKDVTSQVVATTKANVASAVEVEAGRLLMSQIMKRIPLPFGFKRYKKSKVFQFAVANILDVAAKKFAPNNSKINKATSAMLIASTHDSVNALGLVGKAEELIDKAIEGKALKALFEQD